ncbi:protein-N(5)-glutamine methyltransferase PrmC methylates polypeptide chain release factors RF1 and RF2 [Vibrio maritimus]|uniref:Protein-N(5)-glutamine methyltransferase PrmC methylates polypeptide chain release factors RF1 and RF2 n=1 Tax=Vibrio maritimus TaxID=990268 RepID=A0A090THP3_9VIBR|nr:protein-N(5)-glutamine methyltransferase PrmC methylates polypeptide chain release factors RF1 and RF2 [Vibrio maritimus]
MSLDMSIEAVLKRASLVLSESGSDSPSLDAAVLLCHALEKPRSYLLTWPEKELTTEQTTQFDALMARRIAGEPVAYILGEREFWSLPLNVAPSTLIPRPDTERLVELA